MTTYSLPVGCMVKCVQMLGDNRRTWIKLHSAVFTFKSVFTCILYDEVISVCVIPTGDVATSP